MTKNLGRVDYIDRYAVDVPEVMDAPRFCSLILEAAPRWLDLLLSLRDAGAGRLGFHTQERNEGVDRQMLSVVLRTLRPAEGVPPSPLDELIGELYAVPRLNRPMWVAEQLEVAPFEGLPERLWWAAAGRITYRWQLVSGVERNRQYPETFSVPSEQEKAELRVGDLVKLSFELRKSREGERMWVEITGIGRRGYKGLLCNTAVMIPRLEGGRRIGFRSEHIIDWMTAEDAATHDADAAGSGSPIA